MAGALAAVSGERAIHRRSTSTLPGVTERRGRNAILGTEHTSLFLLEHLTSFALNQLSGPRLMPLPASANSRPDEPRHRVNDDQLAGHEPVGAEQTQERRAGV